MSGSQGPSDWLPQVAPRDWQSNALEEWRSDMRGVVRVVTGGGKTTFAHFCMREFWRIHLDGRVLILVPTLMLLDQWYVGLREDLGIPPERIACFSGHDKAKCLRSVNVFVINTARRLVPRLAQDAANFLVVDECHRAASPQNAKALGVRLFRLWGRRLHTAHLTRVRRYAASGLGRHLTTYVRAYSRMGDYALDLQASNPYCPRRRRTTAHSATASLLHKCALAPRTWFKEISSNRFLPFAVFRRLGCVCQWPQGLSNRTGVSVQSSSMNASDRQPLCIACFGKGTTVRVSIIHRSRRMCAATTSGFSGVACLTS